MAFDDDIVKAIRQLMPDDAEIRVANTVSGLNVGVSWKLHDDPERPNKMSKTIRIVVSHEAAQDYAATDGANKAQTFRRINEYLSGKLAAFDPRHNAPKHEPPPVEQWTISSGVLFG